MNYLKKAKDLLNLAEAEAPIATSISFALMAIAAALITQIERDIADEEEWKRRVAEEDLTRQ